MVKKQKIIQKVWVNKHTGQKAVTIPKGSEINPGDWVEIKKLEDSSK